MPEEENKIEEISIDRKSKILFVLIGVLIVGSVAVTFWRYMIKRDYIIEAQTDCDPETENCFIWECDPMSLEEGEKCTGNPDEDIWYYKIFRRNAKNIPLCDPNDENCKAFVCPEDEKDCEEILCTSENVTEGEECSDPEQYLLENPSDEEKCAEDDEECLAEEESAECEEGDEECTAETEEECAPNDEECLNQQDEEQCAPDDEECTADKSESSETEKQENSADDNLPSGVEPL